MRLRYQALIATGAVAAAFAAGHFSAPERIKIETKIVEVEKKVTSKDDKKNTHKTTTTTTTTDSNGIKKTTTVVTEDTASDNKTNINDTIHVAADAQKSVDRGGSSVTVSALGGIDFTNGHYVFGAAVTRPIIGPLTLGAWGLTNATGGVSVGLTF